MGWAVMHAGGVGNGCHITAASAAHVVDIEIISCMHAGYCCVLPGSLARAGSLQAVLQMCLAHTSQCFATKVPSPHQCSNSEYLPLPPTHTNSTVLS